MKKENLYEIAIDPKVELEQRYEAARELQHKKIPGEVITNVIRLYPHFLVPEIAEELGVNQEVVTGVILKYKLYKAI